MRRTTQARGERANYRFHAVEHAFRKFLAAHKMASGLQDAVIHSRVVMSRRDDEIGPGDQALLVHAIVMDQRAARRFATTDPFQVVQRSGIPRLRLRNDWIAQVLLDMLEGKENLDQPRVMVVERAQHRVAFRRPEFRPFLLRERRPAVVHKVEPRERILLGHGSGGKLSAGLLKEVFLPALGNSVLNRLEDQAVVSLNGLRLAITTDSFFVKPLLFRGGDIGSLAVHGTINDLAMGGAEPLWLCAAFILEEGLPLETLKRVVASMHEAAAKAGVEIVTGDTKVVEKGSAAGLFINTTGIGQVRDGISLSASQAQAGDAILVSGYLGDHGIAIMAEREGLQFETQVISDSAPLHTLVARLLEATPQVHCLRDPTRGGLSSTLNEIAGRSRVGMELEEDLIPVREEVRGAC